MSYYIQQLTGDNSLAFIDGTDLVQDDLGIALLNDHVYFYKLEEDSGKEEHIPDVIKPVTNAGNKRWIAVGNVSNETIEIDQDYWNGLNWNGAEWQDPATIDKKFVDPIKEVLSKVIGDISKDPLYTSLMEKIAYIEPLRDAQGEIITTINEEQVIRQNAIEDLAKKVTYLQAGTSENSAIIRHEQLTRTSENSALAADILTMQTTLDGHTTSISQNISSIDGIEGNYSVKINNNGYISGFGLLSTDGDTDPTSEFIVLADKFMVVTPTAGTSETPKVPFVVGEVNGVSTVGINGNLVIDGSISVNKINAEVIVVGDIGAMAYKDQVEDSDITYIKGDTIDTGKIMSSDSTAYFDLDNSFMQLPKNNSNTGIRFGDDWAVSISHNVNGLSIYGDGYTSILMRQDSMQISGDDNLLLKTRDNSNALLAITNTGISINGGIGTNTLNLSSSGSEIIVSQNTTIDADNNVEIDSGDTYYTRFKFGGTEKVFINKYGIYPKTTNDVSCGGSSNRWNSVHAYNYYDENGLFQDKQDDLIILSGLKARKKRILDEDIWETKKEVADIHEESGMEYIDLTSLPTWFSNYSKVKEEVFNENGCLITEEDFEEWIKYNDELGWRLSRNIGAFNDLTNGAVRQLDREMIEMFNLQAERITKLENQLKGVKK